MEGKKKERKKNLKSMEEWQRRKLDTLHSISHA